MARPLKKAGGSWVTGDRFFGRERELKVLEERVREGIHTLLSAPRRIGKTSLVRELLRRLEENGEIKAVFVDLEAATNPPEAIATIASRSVPVRHAMKELLFRRDIKEIGIKGIRVESRRNVGEHNWRTYGDSVLRTLAKNKRPVVLAVDELSVFVSRILKGGSDHATPNGRHEADLFLSWLRKNAQMHQDRLCLIVTGSVSLEPILSRAALSAQVNVYEPYVLKPWSQHEASDCLAALALQYDLDLPDEIRRAMCERLRCCIPHHVQQFFSHMDEHLKEEGRTTANSEDVESVYVRDMLSIRAQTGLDHHQARLKDLFEQNGYTHSMSLLTAAARNDGILGTDEARHCMLQLALSDDEARPLHEDVMRQLQFDGYLEQVDGGYRFVSQLVEDRWRLRHCQSQISLLPWHVSN